MGVVGEAADEAAEELTGELALDERIDDAQPADERVADGLVDAEPKEDARAESAAAKRTGARPRKRPSTSEWRVSAVTGHRSEVRVLAGPWRGVSFGLRSEGSFDAGYVRFEGRGLVRGLHLGRMTLRAGERLALGRGLGYYGSSGAAGVRGGFAVSPSLSKWFGVTGAALEMGGSAWRVHTVALDRSGGDGRFELGRIWNSGVWEFDRGSIGVTAEFSEAAAPEPGGSAAAASEKGPPWRPAALAAHAVFRGEGFDGSAEAARLGGEWFFAGRIATAGRKNRGCLFAFKAPYEVPPGGAGAAPSGKNEQGVGVNLSSRVRGATAALRFSAGQTVSRAGRSAYRRLAAEVERASPGFLRWMFRAYAKTRSDSDFPANAVVREVIPESSRELALRAGVSIRGGRAVRMSARVDHFPPMNGLGAGTAVSLGGEITEARFDARIAVSSHALAKGRRGYVTRPGVGPFEWFGSLYGDGSDVSLRLGLRPTPGLRVFVFYGSSWRGTDRAYAGAEYRR